MFGTLTDKFVSAWRSLTCTSPRGTGYAINDTVLLERLSKAIRGANVTTGGCCVEFTVVKSPVDRIVYEAWFSPESPEVGYNDEDFLTDSQSEVLLRVALIAGDFKIWEGDLLLGTCSTYDANRLASLGEQAQLTVDTLKQNLIETHPEIKFQFIEDPSTE